MDIVLALARAEFINKKPDTVKIPRALFQRLTEIVGYAT